MSLGHGIGVVGTRCQHCWDTVSVLLRCGVGIVGTWCPCRLSVSSGCDVRVIETWCWRVIGRWCRCQCLWEVVAVDMWTATLETSTRCDTICKGEGQQEDGEHTNRKSPQTKRWPVGSIYHRSLAQESDPHRNKEREGGRCCLPLSKARQDTRCRVSRKREKRRREKSEVCQ